MKWWDTMKSYERLTFSFFLIFLPTMMLATEAMGNTFIFDWPQRATALFWIGGIAFYTGICIVLFEAGALEKQEKEVAQNGQ